MRYSHRKNAILIMSINRDAAAAATTTPTSTSCSSRSTACSSVRELIMGEIFFNLFVRSYVPVVVFPNRLALTCDVLHWWSNSSSASTATRVLPLLLVLPPELRRLDFLVRKLRWWRCLEVESQRAVFPSITHHLLVEFDDFIRIRSPPPILH